MKLCVEICRDGEGLSCEEVAKKLNELRRTHVVMIVGETYIEYSGRATSYADRAPRLVVTKPDGTLLVHESTKREPLNWQPPGASIVFECVGSNLRLRSIRVSPREEVIIDFYSIDFAVACRLATTKLHIYGTEEDIVRAIVSNPEVIDPNATVVGRDVATPYGKIDVVLKKPDGKIVVVEVKNERVGIAAITQLKRYVEYYRSLGMEVEGVIVAPSISEEAKNILFREGFRFIDSRSFKPKPRTTLETFFKTG